MRPEVIFELRWPARTPLARPGGAGHDGKTAWHGSNRNGVAGSLRSQQSAQKPALFATRSLAVYTRRNMILKPSLSFAGPRECRWQGLELPVMMGKRRGTAQFTTAPPAGCAASNRHKNLLFSQLARSLAVYSRRSMILKPSLSFAGPREYRWQGLKVPAMMGKRRGTAQITTASPAGCTASNRHKNLLFS